MFENIISKVRETAPLIHCITNYVTVNDVANILLAAGGSPIMADDSREMEDITTICGGLVINIGTLNENSIASMLKAGIYANELNHIVVLDPVGAGASGLRTDTTFKLLDQVKFDVIRGNISEIKTVALGSGTTKGVDADISDTVTMENIEESISFAQELSEKTGAIIAITGAIDIVADSKMAYVIQNGKSLMSRITGTGCMLTSVIAAYCVANTERRLEATAAAISTMGLCGELAYEKLQIVEGGTSTYRTFIIDEMSKIDDDRLQGGCKVEIR